MNRKTLAARELCGSTENLQRKLAKELTIPSKSLQHKLQCQDFRKYLMDATQAHRKYRAAVDKALEILNTLPIYERVKLLFDHWAEDDNYGKTMVQHTRAIKKALMRIPDNLIPASFLTTNARRKIRSLVLFDPFVGNGDVLADLLKITAEQHMRISEDKRLEFVIYINDISPNMVRLAEKKLSKPSFSKTLSRHNASIRTVSSFTINFLDDQERQKKFVEEINESVQKRFLGELNGPPAPLLLASVDIAIVSQTLDVIKGIETKNKVLALLHDYLKVGGNLIVIGEDPARFTVSSDLDIVSTLFFETIFEPFGKAETEAELKRIRNGRLMIIGEGSEKIDAVHSIFVRVAQRIYRPSELGEDLVEQNPQAKQNGTKTSNKS